MVCSWSHRFLLFAACERRRDDKVRLASADAGLASSLEASDGRRTCLLRCSEGGRCAGGNKRKTVEDGSLCFEATEAWRYALSAQRNLLRSSDDCCLWNGRQTDHDSL